MKLNEAPKIKLPAIDPHTGFTWGHMDIAVRPLSDVEDNDKYNRIIYPNELLSLFKMFDQRFAQPIVTAKLEDREIVLNGRKTLKLLQLKGFTEWLIITLHGFTEKDFFRAYDAVSGRGQSAPRHVDTFRCAYRGGSAMHVEIVQAAEAFSLRVPLYEKDKMLNDVRCHRALEIAYLNYGQTDGIQRVFRVLSRCFVRAHETKQLQEPAGTAYFVLGLAKFLSETKHTAKSVVSRFRHLDLHAREVTEEATSRWQTMLSRRCWSSREIRECLIADVLLDAMQNDDWRVATATKNEEAYLLD